MKNGERSSGASGREYPEWVFQLHEDLPSLQDLQDKIAKEGFEALSESEVKKMKLGIVRKWKKPGRIARQSSKSL